MRRASHIRMPKILMRKNSHLLELGLVRDKNRHVWAHVPLEEYGPQRLAIRYWPRAMDTDDRVGEVGVEPQALSGGQRL